MSYLSDQTVTGLQNNVAVTGGTIDGVTIGGNVPVILTSVGIDDNASSTAVTIASNNSVTVGSPTGGPQGAGTINATGLFVNGVAVSTGGSGGFTWSVKTANYTASNNDGIVADTSGGAWTLTLPASPSAGDKVAVIYEPGTSSNLLTIGRNSSKIMGLTEDMTIATADVAITLIYIDTTYGWRIS